MSQEMYASLMQQKPNIDATGTLPFETASYWTLQLLSTDFDWPQPSAAESFLTQALLTHTGKLPEIVEQWGKKDPRTKKHLENAQNSVRGNPQETLKLMMHAAIDKCQPGGDAVEDVCFVSDLTPEQIGDVVEVLSNHIDDVQPYKKPSFLERLFGRQKTDIGSKAAKHVHTIAERAYDKEKGITSYNYI